MSTEMSTNPRNVYKNVGKKSLQKCLQILEMLTNSRNVYKNVYNKKGLQKCLEMSTNSLMSTKISKKKSARMF